MTRGDFPLQFAGRSFPNVFYHCSLSVSRALLFIANRHGAIICYYSTFLDDNHQPVATEEEEVKAMTCQNGFGGNYSSSTPMKMTKKCIAVEAAQVEVEIRARQ